MKPKHSRRSALCFGKPQCYVCCVVIVVVVCHLYVDRCQYCVYQQQQQHHQQQQRFTLSCASSPVVVQPSPFFAVACMEIADTHTQSHWEREREWVEQLLFMASNRNGSRPISNAKCQTIKHAFCFPTPATRPNNVFHIQFEAPNGMKAPHKISSSPFDTNIVANSFDDHPLTRQQRQKKRRNKQNNAIISNMVENSTIHNTISHVRIQLNAIHKRFVCNETHSNASLDSWTHRGTASSH